MAAPIENVCDTMIATVFQSYISDKSNECVGNDGIRHALDILQANELLSSVKSSSNVQDIISHVHSCLGSSKHRGEGILLLNVLVKQCTTSIFQQNALTWIKLLIQIMQGHCALPVFSACCQILGQIIMQSKNFSDLTRELTTSVLPQLLPLLISAPYEVCQSALCCINHCIKTYPGPVGPFKNKIETVLLRQLENSTTSETVYNCYALLSRCGPGGSGGIKHTESWMSQCNQVLGSMENTLTELYDGLETRFNSTNESKDCLKLSTIESSWSTKITSLVSRWRTLAGCLQALLRVELFSTIKVPVDSMVRLISRCLSVNTNMAMNKPTANRTLLASYIPDIHTAALCILDQIIVLCKKNLVTQSSIIVSVLSQELMWTQSENFGFNKQYGYLRSTVYNVLTTWMKVLDGCSGIVTEESNLIKQILYDCTPFTETLQLSTGNKTGSSAESSSSKKGKKRKGYQEISQGISTQRKLHPHANSDLVTAALDALYWILTTSLSELSAKTVQEIQGFIIQTLLTVQQMTDNPIPYSNTGCRRGLYKVLKSLILSSHHAAPSPIQCAIGIFSVGTLDQDLEVSSLCIEAMRVCEVLIHPRVPCLNGPVICKNLVYIGNSAEKSILGTQTSAVNSIDITNGHDRPEMVVDSIIDDKSTDIGENNEEQGNSVTLKRKRADDLDASIEEGSDKKLLKSVDDVNNICINVSDAEDQDEVESGEEESKEANADSVLDRNSGDKTDDVDAVEIEDDDDEIGDDINKESSEDTNLRENNNDKNSGEKSLMIVHEAKTLNKANLDTVSSDDEENTMKSVVDVDHNVPDKARDEGTDIEVENMMSAFIDAGPDSD